MYGHHTQLVQLCTIQLFITHIKKITIGGQYCRYSIIQNAAGEWEILHITICVCKEKEMMVIIRMLLCNVKLFFTRLDLL